MSFFRALGGVVLAFGLTAGLSACTDEDDDGARPVPAGTPDITRRQSCDQLGRISSLPEPPDRPLPPTPQAALARAFDELAATNPAFASRTAADFTRVPLNPQRYDEPAVRRGNASLAAHNPDGSVAVIATFAKFRGDGWALDEVETCRETDPASSYLRPPDPQVTCAGGIAPPSVVVEGPPKFAPTPEEAMRRFVTFYGTFDGTPERDLYTVANFERIPGRKREKASANLSRGAFAGYRPDGSVFVTVTLGRGAEGWSDTGITSCFGPAQ